MSLKLNHMQDAHDGKFCEKCSKCVVDFMDKTRSAGKEHYMRGWGKRNMWQDFYKAPVYCGCRSYSYNSPKSCTDPD